MLIHFKLVEMGLGSMKEVKELNAREVLQALNYEEFKNDYESEFVRLNYDNS